MAKIKRQSNVELLRIISMLLIIAGHFSDQSEVLRHIGGDCPTTLI